MHAYMNVLQTKTAPRGEQEYNFNETIHIGGPLAALESSWNLAVVEPGDQEGLSC